MAPTICTVVILDGGSVERETKCPCVRLSFEEERVIVTSYLNPKQRSVLFGRTVCLEAEGMSYIGEVTDVAENSFTISRKPIAEPIINQISDLSGWNHD